MTESNDVIHLKFLFANKEGAKITLSISRDKHISDVKLEILDHWPEGLNKPTSITSIRLICMGLGVLQDTMTLKECKLPVFPSHPTPMNVSIIPPKSETQALLKDPSNHTIVPTTNCWCIIS